MMSSKNLILIFVLTFCVVGNAMAQKKKKRKKRKKAKTEIVEQIQLDSASYAVGLMMATDLLKRQGLDDLDVRSVNQAIKDVLKGNPYLISEDEAADIANKYTIEQKKMLASKNLKKGEEFLAQNAEREGITVTDSGLQYEILEAGEGPIPTSSDKVKTHYHGTLIDGSVFDSSVERGKPISFPVMGVIKGWQEALQLMPVGSKWRVYIPSRLAYGERGAGTIGPNSALIFDVELLEIE